MSGTSRKVRNPLLTAAGTDFPFEHYPENVLLVPVTPLTPAVLQDDTDFDNFVEQKSTNPQDLPPTSDASPKHDFTFTNFNVNESVSTEKSTDPVDISAKQGYFTSIFSSLNNLSLSSIKSDPSSTEASQGPENSSERHNTNLYSILQDRSDSLPETSSFSAVNPQDSRNINPTSGESNFVTGIPPIPLSQTFPPSLPPPVDGTVSYRLGNQRRLKYAPPPDITSKTAKQFTNPPITGFLSPQNIPTPSTIFNPNASEEQVQHFNPITPQISINTQSEQLVIPEQLSESTSIHESVRSSPVTIGTLPNSGTISPCSSNYSTSSAKPIPSRTIAPATPQNTPANFPSLAVDFCANQLNYLKTDDLISSFNTEEAVPGNILQSNLQTKIKPSYSQYMSNTFDKEKVTNVGTDFTPILAAKVTEKLEHLIAEQKEETTSNPPVIFSSESSGITTKAGTELKSEYLQNISESENLTNKENSQERLEDELQNIDLSRHDSLCDIPLNSQSLPIATVDFTQEIGKVHGDLVELKAESVTRNSSFSVPYYEEQSSSTSSDNFLLKKEKSELRLGNLTPNNRLDPLNIEQQTAVKSFESADSIKDYSTDFPRQNTASLFLNVTSNKWTSNQDHFAVNQSSTSQEYSTFNQSTTISAPYIPQSSWSADQIPQSQFSVPTCDIQAPTPQFYNPAQFTNELYKHQYPGTTKSPLIEQPVNAATHFFTTQFSVPTCDIQAPTPQFYNPAQFTNELYKHQYPGTTKSPLIERPVNAATHFFTKPPLHSQESQSVNPFESSIPYSTSMAAVVPEPTGTATLSPVQISVTNRSMQDTVPSSLYNLASSGSDKRMQYRSVYHHWFYRTEVENKVSWLPFSMQDSLHLEDVHNSNEIVPETMVATDGGRYDVDILRRRRSPVYWTGSSTEVRRCSWFYKGSSESRYVPYEESTALKLEEEYKQACISNNWNRKVELNNGEYITFHSATIQVHYLQASSPELAASWSNSSATEDSTYLQGASSRPRVVKRGVDEFNIDDGEPEKVDHLLFLVHGIGSVCDLKFRTVEEVVDEFRNVALQLVQSHYRTASDQGILNRIEVLPISWHATLHSEDTGIDKKLQAITLESISKLRHFTNDTLLDILFYTSPIYCQTIMQTVGNEMNRLYALFKERNSYFDGEIYLSGHSLGSLIVFDLLCHQKPPIEEEEANASEADVNENGDENHSQKNSIKPMSAPILKRRLSKKISYVMGAAGTGQPYINYPQLNFHPRAFFAFGSPIAMFVTVRGIDTLGEEFALPTCPAFFNIFHPFDPVAYRVESLINPEAHKFRPMLIPHHKGRKRMHLELKETMTRVGTDLKQKLLDSVRSTWNSVYQLALFHKPDHAFEREIDKIVEEQLQQTPNVPEHQNDDGGADFKIGKLNGGRRIDYVLQEAPFEYFNEYIFALTSHVCYWKSEDTVLMILKEIYGSMGIQTDAQLPQQTLSVERSSPSMSTFSPSSVICNNDVSASLSIMGVDPTAPMSGKSVGPPPKTGFIKKT